MPTTHDSGITIIVNEASMDWFGNLAVPMVVLLLSIAVSIGIAVANRRANRRDLDFQRDTRYADEFLQLFTVRGVWLLWEDKATAQRFCQDVNTGWQRYCQHVSGPADSIRGQLGDYYRVLDIGFAKAQAARQIVSSGVIASDAQLREAARDAFSRDEIDELNSAFESILSIVRSWPFVEKRRSILEDIERAHIAKWFEPPLDLQLAVERQMLARDPSPYMLVRLWRRFHIWTRCLREDIQYGRFPDRIQLARDNARHRKLAAPLKAKAREEKRARRVAEREARELKRMEIRAARFSRRSK